MVSGSRDVDYAASVVAVVFAGIASAGVSSFTSSLIVAGGSSVTGSSDPSLIVASCSTFLLFQRLPSGTASSGVRQYVTVLVTICFTVTFPGFPVVSMSISRGEKDALHGVLHKGPEVYGDATDRADGKASPDKGDCGIVSRRGVRDERGAGLAKGDGGIVTRGDSGRCGRTPAAVLLVAMLCAVQLEPEEEFES